MEKFGRLTFVKKTETKHKDGTYFHLFKCDCGLDKLALFRNVRNGYTRSCGCLASENAAARLFGKCPTNKRPEDERSLHWSMLELKNSAKTKKLELTLSLEDVKSIIFCNCHYCNNPPSRFIKHTRDVAWTKVPVNGIDRMDNTKGYIQGNCLPCCSECNYFKSNMPYEKFIDLVKRISTNMRLY